MASRTQRYAVFPHKLAFIIGIFLLLIGIGSTVVGILGMTLDAWGSEIGTGIWCGVIFFTAGISGIVAALLKKIPFIKVFMSCCLVSLIFAFIMVILSGGGLTPWSGFYRPNHIYQNRKDSTKHVHGILLLLGIGSFILNVIGTILGVKYSFLVGIRKGKHKKHCHRSQNRKNRYIMDSLHQELTEEFLSPDVEDAPLETNVSASQRQHEANLCNSIPQQIQHEPRVASRNRRRRKKHKRNSGSSHHHRGSHPATTRNIEQQSSEPIQHLDRGSRNVSRYSTEQPVVYTTVQYFEPTDQPLVYNTVQYFEHPSVQDDEELPPYEEFAGQVDTNLKTVNSNPINMEHNYKRLNSNMRNLSVDNEEQVDSEDFVVLEQVAEQEQLIGAECSVGKRLERQYSPDMCMDQNENCSFANHLELQAFDRSNSPHTSVRLTEEENKKFLNEYWSSQMNHPQGISFCQKHTNSMVLNEQPPKHEKHQTFAYSNRSAANKKISKKLSKHHALRSAVTSSSPAVIDCSENALEPLINSNNTGTPSLHVHDSGNTLMSSSKASCKKQYCEQVPLKKNAVPSSKDISLQFTRPKQKTEGLPKKQSSHAYNEHLPTKSVFCTVNKNTQPSIKIVSPMKQTHLATVMPFKNHNDTSSDDSIGYQPSRQITKFERESNLHLHDSHVRLSLVESFKITQNQEESHFNEWPKTDDNPIFNSVPPTSYTVAVSNSSAVLNPSSLNSNLTLNNDDEETSSYFYAPKSLSRSESSNSNTSPFLSFRNCDFDIPNGSSSSTTLETNSLNCVVTSVNTMMQATGADYATATNVSHFGAVSECTSDSTNLTEAIASGHSMQHEQFLTSSSSHNQMRNLHTPCSDTVSAPHIGMSHPSQSSVLPLGPRMPLEVVNQQQNRQQPGQEQHRPLFSVLL